MEHTISMIATAATQQTAASSEISESAGHISQMAEENAMAADETAGACLNLTQLANELDGMVRQFKIEGGNAQGGRLAPSQAPAKARFAPSAAHA